MSSYSRIIEFGYKEYTEYEEKQKKKHKAKCVVCGSFQQDNAGTTSNFVRHLKRKHKAKYDEYLAQKCETPKEQPKITGFLQLESGPASTTKYHSTHSRAVQITNGIVRNLVTGCTLPLSIVEDKNFRQFMSILEPRYQPPARSTLTGTLIPNHFAKGLQVVEELLHQHENVSLTTDIWTDRTMRSYLGVTAHIMGTNPKSGKCGLVSMLLTCQRFQGSHTGQRIANVFDEIIEKYGIATKVDCIITDNAANMKAAFKVAFPTEEEDTTADEDNDEAQNDLDNALWDDLEEDDQLEVRTAMEIHSRARLSCFAHTLQLVINDGLKETKTTSRAIAKSTKLSSLLHRSTVFKDRFEDKFGTGRTIPAAICTRWNSTYIQLKALLKLDLKILTEVCDTQEFRHAAPTRGEWTQLSDLCEILAPFAEATNQTQGDQSYTISQVVPCILDLNSHLMSMQQNKKSFKKLVDTLHTSLHKRFKGVFINCLMANGDDISGNQEVPFSDKIYLVAAVLDPRFMTHWVDADVKIDAMDDVTAAKQRLKDTLKELVVKECDQLNGKEQERLEEHATASSSEDDGPGPGPAKVPRLLSKYKNFRKRSRSGSETQTPRAQLSRYLEECYNQDDVVSFWSDNGTNKLKYPALYRLAKKVLSVPASSAPTERIFSKGGLIMRPHRARLSSHMFEMLMFLKCNMHIL